jgi:hypothetical protein
MDIREAAYSGNIQALRVLVDEEGADVNEPNKVNQWTRSYLVLPSTQLRLLIHKYEPTKVTRRPQPLIFPMVRILGRG